MAKAKVEIAAAADRCELCGARVGDARERARHLRSAHPQYARNVFFRVAAPFIFLAGVLILAAMHAQPIAYVVALGVSYAFLFFGRLGSRRARSEAGVTSTIGIRRMLREGGLRFVLFVPVAIGLLLLLGMAK